MSSWRVALCTGVGPLTGTWSCISVVQATEQRGVHRQRATVPSGTEVARVTHLNPHIPMGEVYPSGEFAATQDIAEPGQTAAAPADRLGSHVRQRHGALPEDPESSNDPSAEGLLRPSRDEASASGERCGPQVEAAGTFTAQGIWSAGQGRRRRLAHGRDGATGSGEMCDAISQVVLNRAVRPMYHVRVRGDKMRLRRAA
jgi:hypothetical protein